MKSSITAAALLALTAHMAFAAPAASSEKSSTAKSTAAKTSTAKSTATKATGTASSSKTTTSDDSAAPEFTTRPAVYASGFDYGQTKPSDLLSSLTKHCGDTACDSSWTETINVLKGGSLATQDVTITVDQSIWDGSAVGTQLIDALIKLADVGATSKSTQYYDYEQGGAFSTTKTTDIWSGFGRFQINRFSSNTDVAGQLTVTISDDSSCSATTLSTLGNDAMNVFGAVQKEAGYVAPFWGLVTDLTCALSNS